MNPGIRLWTDERLTTAIGVLRGHRNVSVAIDQITQLMGFPVTQNCLDSALRRYGFGKIMKHLGVDLAASKPVVDDDSGCQTERRIPVFDLDEPDAGIPPVPAERPSQPATAVEEKTPQHEINEHRMRAKLSAMEARAKKLVAELSAKDEELASYKLIARGPILIEPPKKVGGTQRIGVPVMMCSDWHVEEPVYPLTVNGLNEYNLDIAEQCIDKMAEAFAAMLLDSPRFDCRTAIVALIGDLISGYIHEELVEANFLSPQEAMIWLLDRLEKMLRKILALCPNLDKIIVTCNSGNHGRATIKQRVSTRESNSLEMVVYQSLARMFKDEPRLQFVFAHGEWIELDVMGFTMAFTHGDSFQSGGGVGGISIPIRRGIARQFTGRKIHQVCMGHFHQRQDFGDIQVNGSMIGYGPYSQRIHAAPEPRQQSWFMIDSSRGKSLSAPIWL